MSHSLSKEVKYDVIAIPVKAMKELKVDCQGKLKFNLLEILQVFIIRQHNSTCVKNAFPCQLE